LRAGRDWIDAEVESAAAERQARLYFLPPIRALLYGAGGETGGSGGLRPVREWSLKASGWQLEVMGRDGWSTAEVTGVALLRWFNGNWLLALRLELPVPDGPMAALDLDNAQYQFIKDEMERAHDFVEADRDRRLQDLAQTAGLIGLLLAVPALWLTLLGLVPLDGNIGPLDEAAAAWQVLASRASWLFLLGVLVPIGIAGLIWGLARVQLHGKGKRRLRKAEQALGGRRR